MGGGKAIVSVSVGKRHETVHIRLRRAGGPAARMKTISPKSARRFRW
jgi:ribosomal protein L37E